MTSEPGVVYVWIWLPDATEPVVCGRLDEGSPIRFTYARSYRARPDAVPVFEPELPLRAGTQGPLDGDRLPLCIDDAMPDSWGRRLVTHRLGAGYAELSELTYLLAAGSDHIGALDFQRSPSEYVPRQAEPPALDELADAARRVEEGRPLDPRLAAALLHGTSIGGARPKALLRDGPTHLIAKFSSTTDTYPVVQGEFVAMSLALRCGIAAAAVRIVESDQRAVLLVERFDRTADGCRLRIVSALTVLGLCPFPSGRYATYVDLAHQIRGGFVDADDTLRELFSRIVFNILCGNTDDHGRNHSAIVGERGLQLAPAYDICPQARSGASASQAMAYGLDGQREARLAPLVDAAHVYHLDRREAQAIVDAQRQSIEDSWEEVCDEARLTSEERRAFFGRQFCNPDAFR